MWWLRQTNKQCIKQLILMGLTENHAAFPITQHIIQINNGRKIKRERQANSFGCMFYSVAVLGLWDHFSIGFVMWLGLAWFVFESCVFRRLLCEFSWCDYVTNFVIRNINFCTSTNVERSSGRVESSEPISRHASLRRLTYDTTTEHLSCLRCHLRVSSNKNDFDNGFFFGLISEKLSSSQLRKH